MFLNLFSFYFLRQRARNCRYTKGCFCLLTFLFLTAALSSQNSNIGIPFTANFSNETYQAGTQNWDIEQHPNGFLFFANNDGLLQFDGNNWQTFPLPNQTVVRSLHIDKSGKIYVGGQGEFGYFAPNDSGQLVYHSLLATIPETDRQFSDVWEIIPFQGRIYFNASFKVYEYTDEGTKVYEDGKIEFLGKGNNRLFIGNESGLKEIKDGNIIAVPRGEIMATCTIVDVVAGESNQLIFATKNNGLFELNQQNLQVKTHQGATFLKENQLYCAIAIDESSIAIGVISEGLLIMDKSGQFLYHLNKQNGLQDNNVLSLFADRDKNLWLGLNNGIDQVFIHAPFSQIIPNKQQEGTAYTAQIFNNQIYFGTSQGLYRQDWRAYFDPLQQNNFQLLKKSAGQVWSANSFNQQLFIGHHEGGFVIKNQQLQKISPENGVWTFLQLKNHPNYLIAGTYEGLELYHQKNGDWQFVKRYESFKESCRILAQDQTGNIWVAHPYRGLFKVTIAADLTLSNVKFYDKKEGHPCKNINVINDEIFFTGEDGVFKYNEEQDTFLHYQAFEDLIGKGKGIIGFFEDEEGNIWYTTAQETGVLKIEDKGLSKSFSKEVYPTLQQKLVRGFEFIYPYDEHNVFFGAEKGFIHFNPSKENKNAMDKALTANIVKVESISNNKDSTLLFGQYHGIASKSMSIFPNELNAFRFSYTAPSFPILGNISYSTKLEGFDQQWSEWTNKTTKEYTNLNAGDYRFLVKVKSARNQIGEIASYAFSIKAPWYASTFAILAYLSLVLMLLIGLIFIPKKRFQRKLNLLKSKQANLEIQQAEQAKEHQKVVTKSAKEISSLKNKNLETEIIHKNRELALTTMHLVQRKELILKLQEPLAQILRKTTDKTAITEIKRINKLLKEDAEQEDSWDQFAHHFDLVHVNFLQRIREQYPQLTANDRKLCAYLRMNLSTKEIAPLMNISIRGVEVARYRLRKKIDLDSATNLTEFMLSV